MTNNNQSATISFQIIADNFDPANPVFVELEKREMIDGFDWCVKVAKIQVQGTELNCEISFGCNENCHNKLWLAKSNISIHKSRGGGFGGGGFGNAGFGGGGGGGGWGGGGNSFDKKEIGFTNTFFNGSAIAYVKIRKINIHEHLPLQINIQLLRSSPSFLEYDTNLEMIFENGNDNAGPNILGVNKFALSTFSGYFRNLFFGNWSERRQQQQPAEVANNSFKIKEEPNFDISAFSKMIYASMAMGWMSNEPFMSTHFGYAVDRKQNYKMAMKIIKLSIKYDLRLMQNCSENFLISELFQRDFPKMKILEEAQQLGLHNLEEQILTSITAIDFGRNITKNLQIHARLGKRTQEQVFKQINKSAKKNGWGEDEPNNDVDDDDDEDE